MLAYSKIKKISFSKKFLSVKFSLKSYKLIVNHKNVFQTFLYKKWQKLGIFKLIIKRKNKFKTYKTYLLN